MKPSSTDSKKPRGSKRYSGPGWLRIVLRLCLYIWPEDQPGISRQEMEKTFFHRYRAGRAKGPPFLFIPRELWSLARLGLRERLGSARSPRPLAALGDDIRFALRAVRKNRSFAVGAIVILALGIGVNTAMFSMTSGMSHIAQRFQDPDELVFLWGVEGGWDQAPISAADFFALRDETSAFQEMGVYSDQDRYLTGDGEPLRIRQTMVSANLLPMLGLNAALGRLTGPADEDPSAPVVAVLTWRFWQERYGGDAGVLGRTVVLNDEPHTIIGVLPAKVEFDMLWRGTSIFTPLALNPGVGDRERRGYRVMARLGEGSTLEQAQAQLAGVTARLAEAHPETNEQMRVRVEPFQEFFFSADDKLAMMGALMAVVAILLIACVNLANYLLAKGADRRGEMAIRRALGASRGRMIRQLMAESVLLALAGGALGILLGHWGMGLLLSAMPSAPFLREEAGLDGALLAYTFSVSVVAALAFGLTPALLASRVSLSENVKDSGASARGRMKGLRNGILVAQVALTVPLVLTCAASYLNLKALQNTNFGFPLQGLLTAELSLPAHRYREEDQRTRAFQEIVEAVRAVPGVTRATAGSPLSIGAGTSTLYGPLMVEGRDDLEGTARGPSGYKPVAAGFFEALGVPILSGRAFDDTDRPGSPSVAIVNEAFAKLYWPDEDPVGKRLLPETDPARLYSGYAMAEHGSVSVIGVVADFGVTFYGEPPGAILYLPQAQHPTGRLDLVVRTVGEVSSVVPAIREAVARVDPAIPVSRFRTGEGMMEDWLQESRGIGAMLGLMAILALGMAMIGLYGMVTHSVARRTFELGVRMVLGADAFSIQLSVMRSFVTLAAVGLLIGVGISAVLGVVARSFLVLLQVSYLPMVLGINGFLMAVILVAAFIPARRATSIQPVLALKCE